MGLEYGFRVPLRQQKCLHAFRLCSSYSCVLSVKRTYQSVVIILQAFVDNSHGQKIKIAVFDEDKASDDESLGTLVSSIQ